MSEERRASRAALGCIAGVFILVRALYIHAVPGSWYLHEEVSPERESYEAKVLLFEEAARSILEGRGYVVHSRYLNEDIPLILEYPPGFSLLLAALYRAGIYSHPLMQYAQLALALLTLGLLFRIARAITSPRAALIAAAVIAVNPALARSDVAIDPCVPAVLLVCVALRLVVDDGGARGLRWSLAGALMGVTGLLFPDFAGLPAFLLLAVAAARGSRYLVRYGPLFCACYLACISPLAVAYHRELGRMALSSPLMGASMMRGIGQFGGTGDLHMPTTFRQVMEFEGTYAPGRKLPREAGEEILMYHPNGMARDRARRDRVIRFMREHPWFVARGLLMKVPRMFAGNITGITPRALIEKAGEFDRRSPRRIADMAAGAGCRAAAAFFERYRWIEWASACGAAAGVVLAVRRRRGALLVAAVPIYLAVAHLPFFFEPRMMTPALPFISVFLAAFLDEIFRRRPPAPPARGSAGVGGGAA